MESRSARTSAASCSTPASLLDDTAGTAESEAWEAFLAYYGSLSGMAKHMAVVAVDLAPIVEFMSHGPRKAPPGKG